MIQRRQIIIALASTCAMPTAALAVPTHYTLVPSGSRVGFQFNLNGIAQTGTIPVEQAKITIDPQQLVASRVEVTLNVTKARTGLIFITQVMTGPEVLDATRFPTIRFVSRHVILGATGRLSGGAKIIGDLTLRGVTKPVTLQAAIYRSRGTAANDLSQLDVTLNGRISRAAFGADGFSDLVSDTVALNIQAQIRAS
ncbi:YceI family protein [Parasedimentitalea maritima]|uniref:YceI family protein n=2 Tax=Parasedimentitalea maritima TaxID=2578117 RepID=A0A6A4RH44_9RHOB|nr:YceI family protein [Zongyanglinia marina]